MGVMLTFGLSAPLVAFAVGVKQIVELVSWRLLIGRYLRLTESSANSVDCFIRLEDAFVGSTDGLLGMLGMILALTNLFWSGLLYDVVADVSREQAGGWKLVVVLTSWSAVALFAISRMHEGKLCPYSWEFRSISGRNDSSSYSPEKPGPNSRSIHVPVSRSQGSVVEFTTSLNSNFVIGTEKESL